MYLEISSKMTIDFDKVTHFCLVNDNRIDFYFGQYSEPGHFANQDAKAFYKKLLLIKDAKNITSL
jgi:hypothetical protein|tara:strand:- start:89 stop:283 length:195 start_codon:yes stop_codon:yes gene_type:complete